MTNRLPADSGDRSPSESAAFRSLGSSESSRVVAGTVRPQGLRRVEAAGGRKGC